MGGVCSAAAARQAWRRTSPRGVDGKRGRSGLAAASAALVEGDNDLDNSVVRTDSAPTSIISE
jgi:hypothetical protein